MTAPVAQVRPLNDGGVLYDALLIWCPGCSLLVGREPDEGGTHLLPVNADNHEPSWSWDGNLEAPTLDPSILTRIGQDGVCHSFVRAGVWQYLGDCTHPLAGQNVPLPPLPAWLLPKKPRKPRAPRKAKP